MYRLLMRLVFIPFLATFLLGLLGLVCNQTTTVAQSLRIGLATLPSQQNVETPQGGQEQLKPRATLVLTKTVGTNPSICATTKVITVAAGTPFYDCYTVQNTGNLTFTIHTVEDSLYDHPLTDHRPYTIEPGPPPDSVALLTVTTGGVQQTTVSTGTWIATTTTGLVATASDTTTVLVPTLHVSETVGTNSHQCATTNQLNVAVGAQVTYCYTAYNPGRVTLRLHNVMDSKLGLVKANWAMPLSQGASIHFTTTAPITQTTTNVFTWTGYITDVNSISTLATATATVYTPGIAMHATVGTDPNICAPTNTITVTAGTMVYYCYTATNTGGVTFNRHEINDTGAVVRYARTQLLRPGDIYEIKVATPTTQTLMNQVHWTAYGDNPVANSKLLSATTSSPITVNVVYKFGVFLFYDVDASGRLNALERGWPNGKLSLQQASGSMLTATTDIDGSAIFTNIHTGPATLSVDMHSLPDGFRLTTGNLPYAQTMQWNQQPSVTLGYAASPTFNSDCDPIPDQLEGPGDSNGNGIPDYLDGNCLYLPMVQR